jgi:hypothetical protein
MDISVQKYLLCTYSPHLNFASLLQNVSCQEDHYPLIPETTNIKFSLCSLVADNCEQLAFCKNVILTILLWYELYFFIFHIKKPGYAMNFFDLLLVKHQCSLVSFQLVCAFCLSLILWFRTRTLLSKLSF